MAPTREAEKGLQTLLYGRNFHEFDLSARIDEATYRAAEVLKSEGKSESARYASQQQVKNILGTLAVHLESDIPNLSSTRVYGQGLGIENFLDRDYENVSLQEIGDRVNMDIRFIPHITKDFLEALMLTLIQRGKTLEQGVMRAAVVSHALTRTPIEAVQYGYSTLDSDTDSSNFLIANINADYRDVPENLPCILDYAQRTRKSLRKMRVVPYKHLAEIADKAIGLRNPLGVKPVLEEEGTGTN